MTHIDPSAIAKAAIADLGKPGQTNTCWSNGGNKWPQDAGLPGIDTDSTTEARKRAKAGYHGWSYHEGLSGVRVGDLLDWAGDNVFHTSCVIDIDSQGRIKSIGSGGPTGLVAYQPKSGGYNDPRTFRGYFRPPADDGKKPAPKTGPVKTSKPKTQPVKVVKGKTYTVKSGDWLIRIAQQHHTSVNAIMRLNRDLIKNRDHIEVGWVLKMP